MRMTDRCTLIDPDDNRIDTVCHVMLARGSEIEDAGVRIELGGLQLIVDAQGVTNDWNVEYQGRDYGVAAVTPYLKRRYPKRDVLLCEALANV